VRRRDRRAAQRRRAVQRRRRAALGALVGLAGLALITGAVTGAGGEGGEGSADAAAEDLPQLPGGGRSIFPEHRVVGFYGAPQDDELGELGIGPPNLVARRLERQAEPYATPRRPVLPAFELLAVIAAAAPGDDGLYRIRQDDAVIERYLRAAGRAGAILLLRPTS
jgi:hypothetical protein